MKMYPSKVDFMVIDRTVAALVAAGFDDVSESYDLFRPEGGGLKGRPFISAGPEERREEFEQIVRSFDPDATANAPPGPA